MPVLALVAFVAATAPGAIEDERGVWLSDAPHTRSASLLRGLAFDSSFRETAETAVRLGEPLRLSLSTPAPLDEGGGLDRDVRQILALILGILPGFGIGHLVAQDRDGFILFLIVDIALYAVWFVVGNFVPFGGWLGGLVWLVVHIIQGLDAYAEAGGSRVVERMRERAIPIAGPPERSPPPAATRLFGFRF